MHSVDHIHEVGGPARFPAGHGAWRLGETALRRAEIRAVCGEQAVEVDHVDPGAGALLGQAVGHHRTHDLLADSDASRPGTEHQHDLIDSRDPVAAAPANRAASTTAAVPWMSSLKLSS